MEASRIANVSAAVLVGGAQAARSSFAAAAGVPARRLARLFEDTLRIGDIGGATRTLAPDVEPDSPAAFVDGLAAAIVAARGERVIVVGESDPLASLEGLLALVAWPEKPVVLVVPDLVDPSAARAHPFGIFRKDALEDRARARTTGRGADLDLTAFLVGLEVERVSLAQLGLAPAPLPPFGGPLPGPARAS